MNEHYVICTTDHMLPLSSDLTFLGFFVTSPHRRFPVFILVLKQFPNKCTFLPTLRIMIISGSFIIFFANIRLVRHLTKKYMHEKKFANNYHWNKNRGMVCGKWEGWYPVNLFNHTSWVALGITTDHSKSVRNRCVIEAKQKYRGMFETQKSGNKTSSGEIGLDFRTHANPKVVQDQVSRGVRDLCWHAAPVANVLWKPHTIR